jgi:hypothetical protein
MRKEGEGGTTFQATLSWIGKSKTHSTISKKDLEHIKKN